MNTLLLTSLLLATTNADIGLKLRQQQQLLQNGGLNFGADSRNNPFFIPKSDGGNLGGASAAATNIEQRANGNAKTERTHTLEELCNDAFHSFLCKPVNERRRRIDGNLRPGAMLPPGVLRPESSNTRENKLLPPQQSPPQKPNKKQPFDLQVPAAQSEQGYFYPKPSNTLEVNKPLRNGYLPPDNGFRFTTPAPTFQTTRIPLVTTTRPPQTTRFPPFTFPTTTQRPLVTQTPTTRQPLANNFDIRFQTTPRPIFTSPRIQTTRPVTIFTPSRLTFTQPIKYETFTPRQTVLNTYLPPVTVATQPPPTKKVPFFTRPPPRPPVFTTKLPPQTSPPPPPPTLPPLRFTTTTFRPSTLPPVTFFTSTPKYQTVPNTYLPPFAEQKFNPVFVSTTTTTPRPTFQTTFKPFPTFKPFTAPSNTYLPPESPAIDIRFGSASNNREGSAILPDAAQNPSVAVKPDEEHNLERLCNDPFHSFLCLPITKTRYRFDGRLRPQAVIPQGVLLTSNTFNTPVKALPELQAGSNVEPTSVPSDSGYIYQSAIQQNTQPFLGYVFPTANQQNLLLSANENSVSSSGYFYPAPSNNGLSSLSTSSSSQTGYDYPKPTNNQQFNFISTTLSPEISSVSLPLSTVSTTPKSLLQSNQFLQNNLLTFQNTNNQPFIVTATEKSQSLESGYNYPKPSINQQFTFPSSTPNPVTFNYIAPKTDTQFIYTTSTPRPNSAFETSTLGSSTFKYQPTGPFMFTGFGNSNPTNGQGISISTTERPSTLVYEYQNQIINQVSPSLPPQPFFDNQKPSNQLAISSVSSQGADFNGYSYPKPEQPLQEQPTINNENGYYYPKPSLSFQDNSLNSFGNSQLFKNAQNPIYNTFSKGTSFSSNQPSLSTPSVTVQQQSFNQGIDQKTAKNINQLLGPSSESNNRDLPPASQFEILKVRKRQYG